MHTILSCVLTDGVLSASGYRDFPRADDKDNSLSPSVVTSGVSTSDIPGPSPGQPCPAVTTGIFPLVAPLPNNPRYGCIVHCPQGQWAPSGPAQGTGRVQRLKGKGSPPSGASGPSSVLRNSQRWAQGMQPTTGSDPQSSAHTACFLCTSSPTLFSTALRSPGYQA